MWGGKFSDLPTEWKDALTEVVEEGHTHFAAVFLGNRPQIRDDRLSARMFGADVEFLLEDRAFRLIGHHAQDRLGTRSYYPIENLTPEGFDVTYQRALAEQNGLSFLSTLRDVTDALAQCVVGFDPHDSAFMTERDANRYHNFSTILFGSDTGDDTEYERALKLGIDPNNLDTAHLFNLGLAMQYYISDGSEEWKQEEGSFVDHEDFVTLTQIWRQKQFALPDVGKLKECTRERLEAERESKIWEVGEGVV